MAIFGLLDPLWPLESRIKKFSHLSWRVGFVGNMGRMKIYEHQANRQAHSSHPQDPPYFPRLTPQAPCLKFEFISLRILQNYRSNEFLKEMNPNFLQVRKISSNMNCQTLICPVIIHLVACICYISLKIASIGVFTGALRQGHVGPSRTRTRDKMINIGLMKIIF